MQSYYGETRPKLRANHLLMHPLDLTLVILLTGKFVLVAVLVSVVVLQGITAVSVLRVAAHLLQQLGM